MFKLTQTCNTVRMGSDWYQNRTDCIQKQTKTNAKRNEPLMVVVVERNRDLCSVNDALCGVHDKVDSAAIENVTNLQGIVGYVCCFYIISSAYRLSKSR